MPTPRTVLIEDDPGPLGMPFFVMEQLDGMAPPSALLVPELEDHRDHIVRDLFRVGGQIALVDPEPLGVSEMCRPTTASTAWEVELTHWEHVIDTHEVIAVPAVRTVIRWIRRHQPAPAHHVAVVHGDLRIGNALFDASGIRGVLDWEMAHLGDPLEDLAWSLARNFRSAVNRDLVAATLEPHEAIKEWSASTGLDVDERSLQWWRLFSHVKAMGIWMTGAFEFDRGATKDLMYGLLGWQILGSQQQWMLEHFEEVTA